MKLREFLALKTYESLSLFHEEEDVEEFTLCDISMGNFTPTGLEYWTDVLDSNVVRFGSGLENIEYVFVDGVAAERIEDFQAALAGYCSVKDDEAWFKDPEIEMVINPALESDFVFHFKDGTSLEVDLKKDEKELH